jgi:hypothetical protein
MAREARRCKGVSSSSPQLSSVSAARARMASVEKSNGKPDRGDLIVKDAHLGGFRDLIVDVVCTHEFGGSYLADVTPTASYETMTPTGSWRRRHEKRWIATGTGMPHGATLSFLPCAMTTSGRIHGELRLLYIVAHRRTTKYFASLGDDEPGVDVFTWRRSQFFWHHRAAIGLANAVSVARCAHLAHPARSHLGTQTSAIDPLLSQPPPPPPSLTVALSSCVTIFRFGPGLLESL